MLKEQLHRSNLDKELLLTAYRYMQQAKHMAELYEANKEITAKYVHATSRGHEAIQIALGLQLLPQDFASPYYRDDSMLLAMGLTPYELMLQLLAKRDDPFSGGRTYYSHPSLRRDDFPKIPHQSSATGMQAIPATGVALGMRYIERTQCFPVPDEKPVCVCSLGDASVTEGEVSEAFQMAVLKSLPILYLVQDNEWDISAYSDEVRVMNAAEYARGFSGMEVRSIDGTDFFSCFETIRDLLNIIRKERRPVLLHASVPLLNHHTSGVRKEWYRDDLDEAMKRDPLPKFKTQLIDLGFDAQELNQIDSIASEYVKQEFIRALAADDPKPEDLYTHMFAPTPITEETGNRKPEGKEATVMVDCALFAIQELMEKHPECLLYGQDVGARLGGVFREAATLAQKFGDERTFNTPIQEAFIIGSTVGMSAVGLKPIVEVQFADYIWPGLNQLFTEVARSCYLSNGKWPVSCIIRVPIGAYGSGGPYHSSSVESVLSNIKGIKVVYPSTGADLKGLMKAAYYDPNPVVILEHKGLYWSKIKGTEEARSIEPDENYMVPIGKSRLVLEAKQEFIESGETLSVITYGMGVYWAKNAARHYPGHVEIIDLRTIMPLDETAIYESVRKHGKCLVISEEPLENSFALSIAGRIQKHCFDYLDAAVDVIGSENLPAIPLNITLEKTMIPNAEKVDVVMKQMLIS
ncbi:MAG TPA: thiamine pyrophosphate-dependent enzyme [Bacteroidia bacterium]|nr:thiamine pyrophosphate-dependent enzyme [Bacteroidia bacterium]